MEAARAQARSLSSASHPHRSRPAPPATRTCCAQHENNYLAAVARNAPASAWPHVDISPASSLTELEGAEIPAALEPPGRAEVLSQPICPCCIAGKIHSISAHRARKTGSQLRLCRIACCAITSTCLTLDGQGLAGRHAAILRRRSDPTLSARTRSALRSIISTGPTPL